MATLLQISEDMIALDRMVEEATGDDGEVNPDVVVVLDEWFKTLATDMHGKMDNYAALVKTMELRSEARKEECERLAKRVQVDANQAKYLKKRMLEFMDLHKIPKVETRRYKISGCGNGGLQPLDMPEDPEKLPKDYQYTRVMADADKIREDLKAGKTVEGCQLLPRGRHLRIS